MSAERCNDVLEQSAIASRRAEELAARIEWAISELALSNASDGARDAQRMEGGKGASAFEGPAPSGSRVARSLPGERIELVLRDKGQRRQCPQFRQTLLRGPLPAGSLIDMGRLLDLGMPCYITSPELTYVLLARRMALGKLVTVGLELCGTYNVYGEELGCAYGLEPIMTPASLRQWIFEAGKGVRGASKARLASRWLASGCGSPMEARVVVLLCLPSVRGGYGLPIPELNGSLELDERDRRLLGRNALRVDLLWPEVGIGVEYESDRYHIRGVDDERIRLDKQRIDAARRLGVQVRSLTRDMVGDPDLLEDFATGLRHDLGLRNRPSTEKARKARRMLHGALVGERVDGVAA